MSNCPGAVVQERHSVSDLVVRLKDCENYPPDDYIQEPDRLGQVNGSPGLALSSDVFEKVSN